MNKKILLLLVIACMISAIAIFVQAGTGTCFGMNCSASTVTKTGASTQVINITSPVATITTTSVTWNVTCNTTANCFNSSSANLYNCTDPTLKVCTPGYITEILGQAWGNMSLYQNITAVHVAAGSLVAIDEVVEVLTGDAAIIIHGFTGVPGVPTGDLRIKRLDTDYEIQKGSVSLISIENSQDKFFLMFTTVKTGDGSAKLEVCGAPITFDLAGPPSIDDVVCAETVPGIVITNPGVQDNTATALPNRYDKSKMGLYIPFLVGYNVYTAAPWLFFGTFKINDAITEITMGAHGNKPGMVNPGDTGIIANIVMLDRHSYEENPGEPATPAFIAYNYRDNTNNEEIDVFNAVYPDIDLVYDIAALTTGDNPYVGYSYGKYATGSIGWIGGTDNQNAGSNYPMLGDIDITKAGYFGTANAVQIGNVVLDTQYNTGVCAATKEGTQAVCAATLKGATSAMWALGTTDAREPGTVITEFRLTGASDGTVVLEIDNPTVWATPVAGGAGTHIAFFQGSSHVASAFVSNITVTDAAITFLSSSGGHAGDRIQIVIAGPNTNNSVAMFDWLNSSLGLSAINPNGTTRFTTDKQVVIATYNEDINILNFQLDFQSFNGTFDTTNGTCINCTFDGANDPLAGGNGWCQAEVEKVWGMFHSYNLTISLTIDSPENNTINLSSLDLVCRSYWHTMQINSNCTDLSNYTDTNGACFTANVPVAYAAYAIAVGNTVYIDLTSFQNNLTNMPFGSIQPDPACEQIACEVIGTWIPGNTQEFTVNKTITATAI